MDQYQEPKFNSPPNRDYLASFLLQQSNIIGIPFRYGNFLLSSAKNCESLFEFLVTDRSTVFDYGPWNTSDLADADFGFGHRAWMWSMFFWSTVTGWVFFPRVQRRWLQFAARVKLLNRRPKTPNQHSMGENW